jgi:hypothetical protein
MSEFTPPQMAHSSSPANSTPLDSPLDLLDGIEGVDFLIPGLNDAQEGAVTPVEVGHEENHALLQFLDGDLDADLSDLISSRDSSANSEQDATAASAALPLPLASTLSLDLPQKSTRKLRHQRKRKELQHLRTQVAELEQELESLKAPHSTQLQLQGNAPVPETGGSGTCGANALSLWERVAVNQRSERLKAEVENAKLRAQLEGQLKIAKGLEKLLRKRPAAEDGEETDQKIRARRLATLHESEIWGMLSERVAELFHQVDAAMAEAGFAGVQRERNGVQVKLDPSGEVYVELVDAKLSPYALHAVADAVWTTCATKRIELDNGYYKVCTCTASLSMALPAVNLTGCFAVCVQALDSTDDTARAEFCVTLQLRRSKAKAATRMHILGKRVVEESRVVVVWATYGQIEGALFDTQRVTLSERGWTLIEGVGSEPSSGGGTLIRSCVHLTPELEDRRCQVGVLADVVIGSYELNMQAMHQEVENRLVQAALE